MSGLVVMPPLSERAWQSRVVDLAELRGWRTFHPFDSRRSAPGWPDLTLVRAGRIVFAELKTETGRVTDAQREWIAELSAVPAVATYLWRPSDWPQVQEVLR